jgi:hypothetical protein
VNFHLVEVPNWETPEWVKSYFYLSFANDAPKIFGNEIFAEAKEKHEKIRRESVAKMVAAIEKIPVGKIQTEAQIAEIQRAIDTAAEKPFFRTQIDRENALEEAEKKKMADAGGRCWRQWRFHCAELVCVVWLFHGVHVLALAGLWLMEREKLRITN